MSTAEAATRTMVELDDGNDEYSMSAWDWLVQHENVGKIDGIATAVAVFDTQGRLLIVQRAAHDSMPNKWELPGGAVDEEDPTILHGAARELLEETGLVAQRFTHLITEGPGSSSGTLYSSSKKKNCCRFTFHAIVGTTSSLRLDPNEHQAFLWATEDEIRAQKSAERDLSITKESVLATMIEAFRLRRLES